MPVNEAFELIDQRLFVSQLPTHILNRGGAKRLFPKNGNLQFQTTLSSETRKVELEKKILKMFEP